jgi:acyl carrier protein
MLSKPTPSLIETIVHEKITAILAERNSGKIKVSGADKLNATLGLTSLDLAFLVAELEAEIGVDPFLKLVSITSVRTVGDLVGAYRQALFPKLQADHKDQSLAAAAKRGQTRRTRRGRK